MSAARLEEHILGEVAAGHGPQAVAAALGLAAGKAGQMGQVFARVIRGGDDPAVLEGQLAFEDLTSAGEVFQFVLVDAPAVCCAHSACCAIRKSDGAVVAWGDEDWGGSIPAEVQQQLRGDVAAIHSTEGAFCAIRKSDGAVVTWGDGDCGGSIPVEVQQQLQGDVAAICGGSCLS